MSSTVHKSPFRILRYIAFLFEKDFMRGNEMQKKHFLHRLTSPVLRKLGYHKIMGDILLAVSYCLSFLQSPLQRALVLRYGRWIVAVNDLSNRDELLSWITDRNCPHIIVIGMGSIGDILQITPVLRALKEKLPTAQIAVLFRSPAAKIVLKNNPNVDSIGVADFHQFEAVTEAVRIEGAADLVVEIRSVNFLLKYTRAPDGLRHPDFDALLPESFFQTAYKIRASWLAPHGERGADGKFTWPAAWNKINFLDAMGMMGNLPINSHSNLDFFPDPQSEGAVDALLQLPKDTPIITVQTGVDADVVGWAKVTGQRPTKLLPPETWRQIVQQLTHKKYAIVQLGTSDDSAIEGITLDLRGKTSLSQAAQILKKAFCHVGTEGGLVHLARAMGTKSVVLFGPTAPAFLGYPQNINLTASDCSGCWGTTKDWYIYCPRGLREPECMNAFKAETICDEIRKMQVSED